MYLLYECFCFILLSYKHLIYTLQLSAISMYISGFYQFTFANLYLFDEMFSNFLTCADFFTFIRYIILFSLLANILHGTCLTYYVLLTLLLKGYIKRYQIKSNYEIR